MAQIADVIKYEGDNATFIWKHPCEDFNSLTQLIVHESQEVIFFRNGQALDLFGPGRYTLKTGTFLRSASCAAKPERMRRNFRMFSMIPQTGRCTALTASMPGKIT